jgi:hypothetical protein
MPWAPRSPEAEDALAVGHDDDGDVASRPVGQHLAHGPAVARADEDAARPLEDVPVLLAGEPHRRRVHDRQHLVGVVDQEPEVQRLVAVVQVREVDVLLERRRLAPEILEHAGELLLLREDARRKEAAQVQRVALGLAERGALVERWVLQEREALECRCPPLRSYAVCPS